MTDKDSHLEVIKDPKIKAPPLDKRIQQIIASPLTDKQTRKKLKLLKKYNTKEEKQP